MTKKPGLLIGAILIGVLAHAGIGQAQTISYADAATLLAKECGSDVKKFCKSLNLGNGRIQNCLEQHQSKVSPTCTSTLAGVIASIEQRQAQSPDSGPDGFGFRTAVTFLFPKK